MSPKVPRLDLKVRLRAASIHLLISVMVAILAAALVFLLWYPGIYREVSGGQKLFLLLTGVDLVLGPMLTFAVFDRSKGWPHLRRDLAVIACLQMAALVYGLSVTYSVRPVAMVFETDRFRVVTVGDVLLSELPQAPPDYRTLPITGPWLLSIRRPAPGDESNDALFTALKGYDVGQRPRFWQPYANGQQDALRRARPLSVLLARYPAMTVSVRSSLAELRVDEGSARFLPMVARGDWVAILNEAGMPVHYVPVDGFF